MIRKIIFIIFILILVLGSAWLFIARAPEQQVGNGRIHIIASFYPLERVAVAVGGDLVTVRTLTPAGAEPHDFEPSSRDFIEIGKAEIFVYNGAGLEPWVKKWEASGLARKARVIEMARFLDDKGVSLIDSSGGTDPHFWLDPVVLKSEAEIIMDALSEIDPVHRDIYRERTALFISALGELDRHFQEGLASCEVRDIVTSHDAFRYLASRYNFSITPIAGISPDEEPAPRDLARIASIAKEKGVKFIFSETVSSPKFSEAIAREIGVQTLVLNTIESLTPSEVQSGEDYISIMETNLTNLKTAMLCK